MTTQEKWVEIQAILVEAETWTEEDRAELYHKLNHKLASLRQNSNEGVRYDDFAGK